MFKFLNSISGFAHWAPRVALGSVFLYYEIPHGARNGRYDGHALNYDLPACNDGGHGRSFGSCRWIRSGLGNPFRSAHPDACVAWGHRHGSLGTMGLYGY